MPAPAPPAPAWAPAARPAGTRCPVPGATPPSVRAPAAGPGRARSTGPGPGPSGGPVPDCPAGGIRGTLPPAVPARCRCRCPTPPAWRRRRAGGRPPARRLVPCSAPRSSPGCARSVPAARGPYAAPVRCRGCGTPGPWRSPAAPVRFPAWPAGAAARTPRLAVRSRPLRCAKNRAAYAACRPTLRTRRGRWPARCAGCR